MLDLQDRAIGDLGHLIFHHPLGILFNIGLCVLIRLPEERRVPRVIAVLDRTASTTACPDVACRLGLATTDGQSASSQLGLQPRSRAGATGTTKSKDVPVSAARRSRGRRGAAGRGCGIDPAVSAAGRVGGGPLLRSPIPRAIP